MADDRQGRQGQDEDQLGRPPRPQRSVVLPSPVVLLSIVAVVMALAAFFLTRGTDSSSEQEVVAPAGQQEPASTPSAKPDRVKPKPKPKPKPVQRDEVFVEVYNNSGITGLAASVGTRATDAGWQVVGTDNWYGSIPTNTVYFPPRLERAAKQLALDLGVDRTAPADGAMKLDRLTLILTGEL